MPRKYVRRQATQVVETANESVIRRYTEALQQAHSLFVEKNKDYNGGVELESYFPFGLKSYAQMIHVKSQRIVSLSKQDRPPTFESVKASAIDLINYAAFIMMWAGEQDE